MKKITAFPLMFLTALFLTLTASAAESAIHSVAIGASAATVSVTAQTDCHLLVALYDEGGQLFDMQSADFFASAQPRTATLVFPDGIPEKAYAKAFLADRNANKPLCESLSTRADDTPTPTPNSDVYAILYADGALVFQYGDTPEPGREALITYPVDMTEGYEGHDNYDGSYQSTAPWCGVGMTYLDGVRLAVTQVEFVDKIQPNSTSGWFCWCYDLQEVKYLENLDTSNVTDMSYMFAGCSALTTLDVSALNASNVTDMSYMFAGCNALTALNVSGLDTSNVTDMRCMFHDCEALTKLDVSNFNTSNVTDMGSMFYGCKALTTLDVGGFDTSNVTDMGFIFRDCEALTALDVSSFNTANVENMMDMFYNCFELKGLDLSNFDTANVIYMGFMFSGCGVTSLDVSNFNTANVTDMSWMFQACDGLTALDISSFDTANVTDFPDVDGVSGVDGMFSGCSNLVTVYASDKFITSQIEASGGGMFDYCGSLVGGNGTKYDEEHADKEYARIDGGASNPGYFTAKT